MHLRQAGDVTTLKNAPQAGRRGGWCPIPRNIQGQAGRGSEQPDPVEDVPAHCRGVGLDDLEMSLPTQTTLWFHDIKRKTSDDDHLHTLHGDSLEADS